MDGYAVPRKRPNLVNLRTFLLIAAGTFITSYTATHAQKVEIIAGGTGFPNTAGEQKWFAFRDSLNATIGDDLELTMLIYGELGPEENLVSGIRRGRIHYANWSGAVTATVLPEMAMIYAPFLFDTYEEADFILDNYLFAAYSQLLAKRNVHLVAWDEIGFNEVYSKFPILVPRDAQSRRWRIASSESARLFAEAINVDVIPLGYTDVVSGLQTNLIEAGENAITMYARTGIASEASHLTITNHSFATSIIVSKKSWFDSLASPIRKALGDAWVDINIGREWTRAEWRNDLSKAHSMGFDVHHISQSQRDLWRKATAEVPQRMIDSIGGESQSIYELVLEAKLEFAARNAIP